MSTQPSEPVVPLVATPTPISLTPLTTVLAAGVALLATVAVGGVLGRAERNHPVVLAFSLGLLIAGALVPLLAAGLKWSAEPAFIVAGLLFAAGLGIGVLGVLQAQTDGVRPTATAEWESTGRNLTLHVTATGLSTKRKLVVEVDALKNGAKPSDPLVPAAPDQPLFYAYVGPDSEGNVDYSAKILVPKADYIVGVSAWNGDGAPTCSENGTAEGDQAGCFVERLDPPPADTSGA